MIEIVDRLVFLLIVGFLIVTLLSPKLRQGLFSRKKGEWLLDAVSLLNHFAIIPFVQVAILFELYSIFLTEYKNTISISPMAGLLLNMLIDYGWYWNHRILHSRTKLWNFHMVHHAANSLDVLATARNSFWSPILMVYIWAFSLILFLLSDPTWFLIFSAFGLVVNFWGHTSFNFKKDSISNKFLSLFLITPLEHHWHHSNENSYCNFGTVFNFWDKIHGTWYSPAQLPLRLGFPVKLSWFRQIFFPF